MLLDLARAYVQLRKAGLSSTNSCPKIGGGKKQQ